jgi:hypothetical protein
MDESFLDFSPIRIGDLYLNLSVASLLRHARPERDSDSSEHAPSDDEEELHDHVALEHLEDDENESGFGDSEQVVIASDQYSWKIDHARGDHKFRGTL